MLESQAKQLKAAFSRNLNISIENDFNETDQFYLRVYVYVDSIGAHIQALIKGNYYNPKIVIVGLGVNKIGFKVFNVNSKNLGSSKTLKQFITDSYNKINKAV